MFFGKETTNEAQLLLCCCLWPLRSAFCDYVLKYTAQEDKTALLRGQD